MVINWKQNRVLVVTAKTGSAGIITIVPGVNLIPDDAWKAIRPDLQDRIGKDLVEVGATEKKEKDGGTTVEGKEPSKMSPAEAEALLPEVFSIPVLKTMLEKDSRESVRAAIYRRITELEEQLKAKA